MIKLNSKATLSAVCAAAALLCGCQSVPDILFPPSNPNPLAWVPPMPPSVGPMAATGNRPLRPDDRVEVSVQPPSQAHGFTASDTIDALGVVTLPYIGDIRIDRLTTTQAESAIRAAYVDGGIFSDVNVQVICPGMIQARRVFVSGSVRRVAPIDYRDGMKLMETIIEAGGLNDYASGTIAITRGGVTRTYSLDRIKSGKEENPMLLPDDVIEARESRF